MRKPHPGRHKDQAVAVAETAVHFKLQNKLKDTKICYQSRHKNYKTDKSMLCFWPVFNSSLRKQKTKNKKKNSNLLLLLLSFSQVREVEHLLVLLFFYW